VPVKMTLNHGCVAFLLLRRPGGAPDRGLLGDGSRLPPAPRGPHQPDAPGRSAPAGRGGVGSATGRPVRDRRVSIQQCEPTAL
jgi:hypothetical protein